MPKGRYTSRGVQPVELLPIPEGQALHGFVSDTTFIDRVHAEDPSTHMVGKTISMLSIYSAYISGDYDGPRMGRLTLKAGLKPFMFYGEPTDPDVLKRPVPVFEQVSEGRHRVYMDILELHKAWRSPEEVFITNFGGLALSHTTILLNSYIEELSNE